MPHITWCNLLNINLKLKSFYNSIEWSQLYLQENIPPWLVKIFKFRVFRFAFCENPPPWHNLIISPPCRTILHKFATQKCVPPWKAFFGKKSPSPYFKKGKTIKGSPKMRLKAKRTTCNSDMKYYFMARYCPNCRFFGGPFLWAA